MIVDAMITHLQNVARLDLLVSRAGGNRSGPFSQNNEDRVRDEFRRAAEPRRLIPWLADRLAWDQRTLQMRRPQLATGQQDRFDGGWSQ